MPAFDAGLAALAWLGAATFPAAPSGAEVVRPAGAGTIAVHDDARRRGRHRVQGADALRHADAFVGPGAPRQLGEGLGRGYSGRRRLDR